jgi:hypothetical protein
MSAEEITTKSAAEQKENLGFARRLSKRLSLSHGSKGGSEQGGKGNEILNRSSSIRDELSQGNFSGAKEVITKGQTTKESLSKGDAGGASGSAGTNQEDLNKENTQEAGQQISKGGIGQDNTGKASAGVSNVEQRGTGNEKQEPNNEERKTSAEEQNDQQKEKDAEREKRERAKKNRRGSVAAGILEANHDIRKGPITEAGTFQEKNFHNKGGRETLMKRDATSKALTEGDVNASDTVTNTAKGDTDQAGSSKVAYAGAGADKVEKAQIPSSTPGKTRTAVAGGDYSESFIDKELHDQENISSDVFDDGNGPKSLSRKEVGQDSSGKYHLDKAHLDKQGSQTSQSVGESAAAAAALAGGYGVSKGVTRKATTPRNLTTKASPSATTSAARGQDPTSISPKSGVAAIAGGSDRAGDPGLSNKYKSYAHAASGQGSPSETPVTTGNSTPRGIDEPGGLRSTATSQANRAFYPIINSGSSQPAVVGGGTRGVQPSSEQDATAAFQEGGTTGALNNSKGISSQAGMVSGGGIRQTSASGVTSKGGFSNLTGFSGTASSGSKSTVVNGVHAKRTVRQLSTGSYKLTVLQEKVQAVSQKCKTQLGLSSSEISKRSLSVDAFFDAVAAERLRWMPRDGSRLDCSLRWASRLAYAVDALRESVGAFTPAANEAATLIWGFSILLLEVCEDIMRLKDTDLSANNLYSLILTTPTSSRVSLVGTAVSLSGFTCSCSTRPHTSHLLSSSQRLPQSSPTCSRWSVAPPSAASRASKAKSLIKLSATTSTGPLLPMRSVFRLTGTTWSTPIPQRS